MEGMQLLVVAVFGSIFVGGLLGLCLMVLRAWNRLRAHATRNLDLDTATLHALEKELGANPGATPKSAPKHARDEKSEPDNPESPD